MHKKNKIRKTTKKPMMPMTQQVTDGLRNSAVCDDLVCRSYSVNAQSFDAETRSVEAILATETPTAVFDFCRGEVIQEVLLMRGCQLPANGQVPLLDNHSRMTVSHVMGSTRQLRIERDKLIGRNYFARRAAAEEAMQMVRDGHITDNSVGYRILSAKQIAAGKSITLDGRTYTAPAHCGLRIVTQWQLLENSLCAIGADNQAKVRADAAPKLSHLLIKEFGTMDYKEWLAKRGLTLEELSEQQATALRADFDAAVQRAAVDAAGQGKSKDFAASAADRETLLEQGRAAELQRQKQIRQLAGDAIPGDIVQRAIDENWTIDRCREEFLTRLRNGYCNRSSHLPAIHTDTAEITARHLEAAFLCRSGLEEAAEKYYGEQICEQAEQVRDLSLVDLCREAIRLSGHSIPRSREEMIRTAFSTASLPTILGNIANKSLLAGYTALPGTWELWCQIGSVQDFKENTRVRLTDVGELEPITNGGEIPHGQAIEEAEKFAIATYGKQFSVTRTNIINDDLATFTQVPRKLGVKAAMKVHQLVYAHFLNPGNMSDGKALFHSNHGNLNTSSPLIQENLAQAIKAFRLQTDADGQPISVEPKYLLVPPSLERKAREILESDLLIGQGANASPVPNRNIYKGALQLIVEPRLENANYTGSSATTWYVIADPNTIDTVEVAFLNGRRTPTVERFGSTPDTLGVVYRVYIDVGAKALDFRGLQKNTA